MKRLFHLAERSEFGQRYRINREWSWPELQSQLPIADYSSIAAQVDDLKKKRSRRVFTESPLQHFQLTSGSSQKCKWIPYTRELLHEFDNAVGAWLYDLARTVPAILEGKHYWSLSWIPQHLRQEISADDTKLLPWWKQFVFSQTMAVPHEVSMLPSFEDTRLATLTYLCSSKDLSLISIWSPTFFLALMEDLVLHKYEIAKSLNDGRWARPSLATSGLACPRNKEAAHQLHSLREINSVFLKKLWPNLALISAWGSSTSVSYAEDLKSLFSHVQFQAKGLWATEGVVTFPFRGKNLLAVTSHVYEFKCLQTQKILRPWELELGQRVQPIMSTGSGFFRYALADQLEVCGFEKSCPALEFKGRLSGCDMVGEKLDSVLVGEILQRVSQKSRARAVSLIGSQGRSQSKYCVLIEGPEESAAQAASLVEDELQQIFHYRLARDLGQLAPVKAVYAQNVHQFFLDKGLNKSLIAGNQKIEPLLLSEVEL